MFPNYNYSSFNQYDNFYRTNVSPFNPPRINAGEAFLPKKGFTLTSALTSAEKGIDTISSLIPIYQKVKPVIENGKDIFNVVKKKFIKQEVKKETPVEHVDVEIVDTKKKEDQKQYRKEENKPNNPFF